ncbi:conserved hypothetical protein [Vibrio chagasii]|uniref:Uncharacterized protein n=1 Tax=Vibrio crassostreae TaxID=246167 RepID=A0A822MUV3_9VIBR|nr:MULTISPECIES: hypothetical protein [Vibrio]CAH6805949.1 conserved hypothetical protein [Vibrio chagasii]MDH5950413.1 hypothetical protein [Vibrio crassostreae]TCN06147.1 hypothetical protein EDB35_114126 [Vibrio crassostreae]TCT41332.1 hypothetical protein EDB29_103125 [Vibrio crassostreae]TCU05442.1 hypothetical protein EDB32_11629 [Vibrio crassostreae]
MSDIMSFEQIVSLSLEELEQRKSIAEHQLHLTTQVQMRYPPGSQDHNMSQFLITSYQSFIDVLEQTIKNKKAEQSPIYAE